ncbi:diguanylate cyclase (GGDEF)-like protein [Paucimonas lemoignei]|uniref:Diguanylate cyclase (GGDEF)-like protein n=1 Tax=Paucimonas lemoignei TaxID=29443 RepID=A0A4R3HX00_PAULE|nr:GGDEF domain-containing response regulator [Paucimonas lemoignei]TCS37826.1 diguanylate cyclase (GGDEF)-like protein [Paucimonas lemoignei]
MNHALLRVLLVEDADDDAQLLLRLLRKEGYAPDYLRVDSPEEMAAALSSSTWDLIIADYAMPGFTAHDALKIYKHAGLDIPFIIVSGHIDDVSAVAAMRAGAHDYLLKDNLARLAPVIARELDEVRVRAAKRRAEQELRFHACHDPLTGLLNRREFERAMELAVSTAQRDRSRHVLCYLDLDQFKLVNDTCGHIAGDELLRQLSAGLAQHVRGSDTLARLGGDEFGLLLANCPLDEGLRIIAGLQDLIRDFRFHWREVAFQVGCSIGVTVIDGETADAGEAMSAADVACYVAKEQGRNRCHVYEADDHELAQRRREMQWISAIGSALEKNSLVLYRQPIYRIARDAAPVLAGYEILLRMLDDGGALIPPNVFIPAAERFKLMASVDRWVVRRLFSAIAAGKIGGELLQDDQLLFVNISAATINDASFFDYVQQQLAEFSVSPRKVCLEITESAAIANLAASTPLFARLRQLGCRFALDDFGSGLSSFGYLRHLPVDFVKIDGGFVRNIAHNVVDMAMVEAINKISHVMGLQTIAEFVESPEVLHALCELGVEYAQGYLLGRPQILVAADPVSLNED